MTEQIKSFTEINLETSVLAISLRQIARKHPGASWVQCLSSDFSYRWGVGELADHLFAIHTVMNIISETPNAYINREALDGLREKCKLAIQFLETPWVAESLKEINSRLP